MLANIVTSFRTILTAPLFLLLAFAGDAYRGLALALFLGSGLLDIVDGQLARRLNQTSRFGAMLDLVGDRLLTLAAVFGLIAGGGLNGPAIVAGVILVVRCIVVSALNESLPGQLEIRVSTVEKIKIALSFLALSLLIAPPLGLPVSQRGAGEAVLWLAAALTAWTLLLYWLRALKAYRSA